MVMGARSVGLQIETGEGSENHRSGGGALVAPSGSGGANRSILLRARIASPLFGNSDIRRSRREDPRFETATLAGGVLVVRERVVHLTAMWVA
jgi:hypothetical protein